MDQIAKYQKKPIIVEAEMFKLGMEDGYACYSLSGEFTGHFAKGEPLPRNNRKPAIKTLEGWYEVEEEKHFIVTGIKGERYPVEVEIFHELYDLVEEDKSASFSETYIESSKLSILDENEHILNMPGNSSIHGTENLEYLLGIMKQNLKKSN